jgi:acyl carrier protein
MLVQHPSIRENVVVVREDMPGDKRLIAYAVPKPGSECSASELRRFLTTKLPKHMIPSVFVMLESLPLTANGKVDRRALPAPDPGRPDLEETYIAPRTTVEMALSGIWGKLLGLERVGVHDNFFELGGDSLLATQVISRICDLYQVEIPLRTLFETPTIAGIAMYLVELNTHCQSDIDMNEVLADLEALSEEEAEQLLQLHDVATNDLHDTGPGKVSLEKQGNG